MNDQTSDEVVAREVALKLRLILCYQVEHQEDQICDNCKEGLRENVANILTAMRKAKEPLEAENGRLKTALVGLMKWSRRYHGNSWQASLDLWLTRYNPRAIKFEPTEDVFAQWSEEAREFWADLTLADEVYKSILHPTPTKEEEKR